MRPIILSADSTMDMPAELIRRLDLRVIASYVTMGDKTLPDWPDVSQEELLGFVRRSGKLAQTSAANPDDYERWFRSLRAEGRPILHIAKSSGISSCYQNACLAAQNVGNVWVLDSKSLAGGSAMIILEADRCGIADPDALMAHLEAYRERIEGSFIIETLEFLRKGGRCSGLAALGANILRLRPEILIEDGVMRVGRKYRGPYSRCVYDFLNERLARLPALETELVYINHSIQDPALLAELRDYVREKTGCKTLIEYPASAAISTHCGPNTFGVFFVRKEA